MRGLSLKAVPGMETRPTTDKVKEAIFNIIGPYFSGGTGLDLYAGSGGLGLEALSRGVERVIFVDRSKKAVDVIRQNLEACRLQERAEVYKNEATRALKALINRKATFSYVFLDPPYGEQHLVNDIRILDDFSLLEGNAVIVCEHGRDVDLPEVIGQLSKLRQETYGDTIVTIYRYTNEEAKSWQ